MPDVYLARLVRPADETDPGLRPEVPAGVAFVALMAHVPSLTCVVAVRDGAPVPAGLHLLHGDTWEDMSAAGKRDTINRPGRRAVDDWCRQYGFTPLPANVTLLADVVHHICRQVNPAADLDVSRVAG